MLSPLKVSRTNSVSHFQQTPIFEWCVVRCGSKNAHHKKHVFEEFGLCTFSILGLLVDIILGGDLYDHSVRIFSL